MKFNVLLFITSLFSFCPSGFQKTAAGITLTQVFSSPTNSHWVLEDSESEKLTMDTNLHLMKIYFSDSRNNQANLKQAKTEILKIEGVKDCLIKGDFNVLFITYVLTERRGFETRIKNILTKCELSPQSVQREAYVEGQFQGMNSSNKTSSDKVESNEVQIQALEDKIASMKNQAKPDNEKIRQFELKLNALKQAN